MALRLARIILPAVALAAFAAMAVRADGDDATDPGSEQEQTLFRGMPAAEGRLQVFGFCGSCHSIDLVLQQGLSRAVWEEVLVEMVEDQEMAPLPSDIRAKVLDYLERYYGPDRKARTEGALSDALSEGVPRS